MQPVIQPLSPLDVKSVIFKDIDELPSVMNGWEIEWRQLEAGNSQHEVGVIASQRTTIQSFCLSQACHQQGVAPSEMVTFGFLYPKSQLKFAGREIPCPAVFNFNNPNGFDVVSGSTFSGISVSIAREQFSRITRQLGLPDMFYAHSKCPVLRIDEDEGFAEFREFLLGLCQRLRKGCETNELRWAAEALDKELPYRLLMALDDSRHQPDKHRNITRQKGLRVATAFIEANAHDNPSVPEICVAAGLSSRSLDRAFKEHFGIGPKRYLLNFRLIQVRRELKCAPPATKVADVANHWAFWHLGDFAREYQQTFGEYPAESMPT
jgi:AraC-like DNA-binding protein